MAPLKESLITLVENHALILSHSTGLSPHLISMTHVIVTPASVRRVVLLAYMLKTHCSHRVPLLSLQGLSYISSK